MLLDKGYCSIYEIGNSAAPGDMPVESLTLKYQSWYGELNFETAPKAMDAREGVAVSNRIRILQNRSVNNNDVAVLSSTLPDPEDPLPATRYNITRAFHGIDEQSGEPITDLTLEMLEGEYE